MSVKSIILTIIMVIALIVFCASGYMLASYYFKAHKAQSSFSKLVEEKESSKDKDRYRKLYKKNPDMVGWVKIKGTKVDYPVMQTKDDPQFYLHRNFEKEWSNEGTPFMDSHSDINLPTFNWLIYGHHMKSGIMFHDITKYKSYDFYKDHKTFTFDTVDKNGEYYGKYQVIAACYSKVYPKDSKAFKYYEYAGCTSEEDFHEYIEGIKEISAYDTGVTAEFGDQLVTLTTCNYHTENGRFFIVGKKLME